MSAYYINGDIIVCILSFLNLPDLCRVQTSSKLFSECATIVKGQLKEVTVSNKNRRKSTYDTPLLREYLAPFTNVIKLILCEFDCRRTHLTTEDCQTYHENLYTQIFSNIPVHVSSRLSHILIVMDDASRVEQFIITGFLRGRFKFSRLQHVYAVGICGSPSLDHYDCEKAERRVYPLSDNIKDLPNTIRQHPVLNTYSYYGSSYFRTKCLELLNGADGLTFSETNFALFKLCYFNEYRSLTAMIGFILAKIGSQFKSLVVNSVRMRQLRQDQVEDWLGILRFIVFLKHEAQEFVLTKCRNIDETITIIFKERRRGKERPEIFSLERTVQEYYAANYLNWNEEDTKTVQPKRRRIYKRR